MRTKTRFLLVCFILVAGVLSFQLIHSIKALAPIDEKTASNKLNEDKYFYEVPKNKPTNIKIKILKSKRTLELYGDELLMGKFKIGLGNNPSGDKIKEGDGKTPIGSFYICTRLDKSRFKYFMGISYPNKEDALRGQKDKLISQDEFDKINHSIDDKKLPPWNTALGGEIGIHGCNNTSDWTAGCIALSEEDIDRLWSYAKMGTSVEIIE